MQCNREGGDGGDGDGDNLKNKKNFAEKNVE